MKPFERRFLLVEPFLPHLIRKVRRELVRIAMMSPGRARLLDVGGRKSHCTIGVPAEVCVTDIPRKSEIQKLLNLGVTDSIFRQLLKRRSNVRWVVFDDMTQSSLRNESFDCIVAVEVLEHVERDAAFVHEVHRILRPGGVFVMTTPNGDSVPNSNPDHKRHYKREELRELLTRHFVPVEIDYAAVGGIFRRWGLRSWSVKKPLQTVLSMAGNFVNQLQSSRESVRCQAAGTKHLFAVAWKAA